MIISDKNFVREQIAASEYAGTTVSVLIKSVIDALDKLEVDHSDNDKIEGWLKDAVSLYRSQPIVSGDDRQWEDFQFGDVFIRETVRVRPDAYSGCAATKHNGRVGRVLGTSGYRYSIVYEDKSELPAGPTLHEHTVLQRLVK